MKPQENRLRPHVLAIGRLLILGMAAACFAVGYGFGHKSCSIKTPAGTIELRYNSETGWFELWEAGVLTAEPTATELGLENVPDPKGWTQRFFWVPIQEIKPEYIGKHSRATATAQENGRPVSEHTGGEAF